MSTTWINAAIGLVLSTSLLHADKREFNGSGVPVLQPPVTRRRARAVLMRFPVLRELGFRKDSRIDIDYSDVQLNCLPELSFRACLSWRSVTQEGEVCVGAYDRYSLFAAIYPVDQKARLRFYSRSIDQIDRKQLLTMKKTDVELERIARAVLERNCPWSDTLNTEWATETGFPPSMSREVWFCRMIGGVWVSELCRIQVEYLTGRVVLYQQYHAPVGVSTKPAMRSPRKAALAGMLNLRFVRGVYKSLASLGIHTEKRPFGSEIPVVTGLDPLGCQRLVWQVLVEGETSTGEDGVAWLYVDDRSGEVIDTSPLLESPSWRDKWRKVPKNPEPLSTNVPVLIDGRPLRVFFPPLDRAGEIFLMVDCLKPWGVSWRMDDRTLVLRSREGKELLRTRRFWNRRGLIYVPLKQIEPLLKGSVTFVRIKGKPTVSFVLPRRDHETQ